MASRNLLGGGLVGLTVTFLVILLVSSFLRPYRREGFASEMMAKAAKGGAKPCSGPNC